MDAHASLKDPPARSPVDRDRNRLVREDSRSREPRIDTFYRGRSPGHIRERRRSRSPVQMDRYEPRPRGRDEFNIRERDDRSRRITSPPSNIDRYVPGQEGTPPILSVNPLLDPALLPYQVGFSYYGEWWRTNEKIKAEKERVRTGKRWEPDRVRPPREAQEEREKERTKIQAAYDAYRQEIQTKMARAFVSEHKREQWFRERYAPDTRDPFRLRLNDFRRGLYAQWEQDLESGAFDDFTLDGLPKNEGNGAGQIADREEGEATNTELPVPVDFVSMPGAEIRDDHAYQPTLLIKTIAPHVSRQNLESFCKEHLGEGEGGFKWISLSDPNPSKRFHRIGWVMLHPTCEVPILLDRGDNDDQVSQSPITTSAAERALDAINGKTVKDEARGDFVCHVGVHTPHAHSRKKVLWDLFSAPERIEKDLSLVQRLVNKYEEDFGSDFNAILKVSERVEELRAAGHLQPTGLVVPAKRREKQDAMLDIDAGSPVEEEEEEEEEGMVDEGEDVDDEYVAVKKKQMDFLIEYLRRVFHFCFFCVFESDSIHELARKCPGGHLRRPRSSLSSTAKAVARASATREPFPGFKNSEPDEEGEVEPGEEDKKYRGGSSKTEQQLLRAYNWVKVFEDKLGLILDPGSADLRKLGGRPIEEWIDEEMVKYVKQEDEFKWRCKLPECTKLFKEEHFWRKHVEKRHTEWLEGVKQDFELINAYVLDPSHIVPQRTDPNPNGQFPQHNGQLTTGPPRAFNLSNFAINGMTMPNFPMPGTAFPTFFGAPPPMPTPGWTPPMDDYSGAAGGVVGMAGGGPLRRGGMSGGHRGQYRTGPYDRRSAGRWDGAGAMSGFRGRNFGGGRWGDGAAGLAAVGPKEAVQGRSLKSYEDLDQVLSGGGGELNY